MFVLSRWQQRRRSYSIPRNLGITDIHLGSPDKVATFDEYTDVYDIKPEHVLLYGTLF
jgi:3-deoxy-D-manno-octulosonate 8-phosphate phosphatase KdsC-like HAD superfamily phosphatase